jgi:hypothetical protein
MRAEDVTVEAHELEDTATTGTTEGGEEEEEESSPARGRLHFVNSSLVSGRSTDLYSLQVTLSLFKLYLFYTSYTHSLQA